MTESSSSSSSHTPIDSQSTPTVQVCEGWLGARLRAHHEPLARRDLNLFEGVHAVSCEGRHWLVRASQATHHLETCVNVSFVVAASWFFSLRFGYGRSGLSLHHLVRCLLASVPRRTRATEPGTAHWWQSVL